MEKSSETAKKEKYLPRPPVVVVLGHIDHGKTTLLDYIRKTQLAKEESGGITQHIGAYEVKVQGRRITFIDTPGHEAFSKLRSHGARVSDIAVVVVAADDGVQKQTKEAIKDIKQAGIPFIVAINKIDKPQAKPEEVKKQLTKAGVMLEGWGGEVPYSLVSAKTGKGVEELLELIILTAEISDLKYSPEQLGKGVILTARRDAKKGIEVSLLVKEGRVQIRDYIATASSWGFVKYMKNWRGEKLQQVLPSTPVLIGGFKGIPKIGEEFQILTSKVELEDFRRGLKKTEELRKESLMTEDSQKVLYLILKADEEGSLEAMNESISQLKGEIPVKVISKQIGSINFSDIALAVPKKARIVGFNVTKEPGVEILAQRNKIQIATSKIIYEIIDKVKEWIKEAVFSQREKSKIGIVEVLAVFLHQKDRTLVGGKVIEGLIRTGGDVKIFRDGQQIGDSRVESLKRERQSVGEVKKGAQCGIMLKGKLSVQVGDKLEIFD